ncbi:MAG: basic secretory family protein [Kiritimatiellaeota bacterium]|nr:basic secretory family protein [Kiritimatiellota bacterium]
MKLLIASCCCVAASAFAEPRVNMVSSPAANNFGFSPLPRPVDNDDATGASLSLVEGTRDGNGASLDVLTDGRIPKSDDDPRSCFFFAPNTDGGRVLMDLGSPRRITQVNTYSWHNSERSPQVYDLYASDGTAAKFETNPKRPQDPQACGWRLIARVDTRTKNTSNGQQIVSVTDTRGELGNFRYLLFDIRRTTSGKTPFDNTFYCEFDVVSKASPPPSYDETVLREQRLRELDVPKQSMRFIVDYTSAPQLEKWVTNDLLSVCESWYPKLRTMLASPGHTPASLVTFRLRTDMDGPASAGGGVINLNAKWVTDVPKEAVGASVHEMVHIVQAYGKGNTPGWLVEGIADYIRWFLFEPESRGAEITSRNIGSARYDGSYRVSANFLDWAVRTYGRDGKFLLALNATLREGTYTDDFWKAKTGKTLTELNDLWLADCRKRIEAK